MRILLLTTSVLVLFGFATAQVTAVPEDKPALQVRVCKHDHQCSGAHMEHMKCIDGFCTEDVHLALE